MSFEEGTMVTLLPVVLSLIAGAVVGVILGVLSTRARLKQEMLLQEQNLIQASDAMKAQSDLKIEHLEEKVQTLQSAEDALVKKCDEASEGLNVANTELATLQQRVAEFEALKGELRELNISADALKAELAEQAVDKAHLETTLREEQKNSDEKIKLLSDAKVQLTKDFENLANRIFEEKNEKFKKQSESSMAATINPLREQLDRFKKKVEEVYEKENNQRVSLLTEITHLKDLNKKMSEEAVNLTKALKGDNKAQGNWGEVILERVLEESGLKKGREYETQVKLQDDDGQRRYPDVIVRLPDNRDIVIDSKVSLVDYERYCSADDEDEREAALKAHVLSLRNHVRELSAKDYAHLESIRTLDFVFIFIPIEAAFLTAVEFDQGMFKEAYEKNIIIVSPTTLLATLRTVESIWRYEKQNKNAEEIAKQAGSLHDQVVLVVDALEDVGRHIGRAQDAHDLTMKRLSKGRGNLIGQTVKLEKLGAKAKKMLAKSMAEASVESEAEALLVEASAASEAMPELEEGAEGLGVPENGQTELGLGELSDSVKESVE